MAVLNVLKINEEMTYIISDEEYLTARGLRRTYHSNNIHSIMDNDLAEVTGMNFFIGFVGSSNFGMEFVERVKSKIAETVKNHGDELPHDTEQTAELAGRIMTSFTKEKVNSRLEYLYGFTIDDINRTYIIENDQKTEIRQSDIIRKALEIINKKEKSGIISEITGTDFVFIGYDRESGIQIYMINPENCVLNPMPSLFVSIGAGADVCNLIFAELLNRTPLQQRREGIDPVEGLVELFWSINQASLYNHQVGGYCHLCIVDKNSPDSGKKVRMFSDHIPKIGSDIVKAYKKGWLNKADTFSLMKGLFFEELSFEDAEKYMFKYTTDPKEMDLYLRGYKYFEKDKPK